MLQYDIQQAFIRKNKVMAISFDLEKAYDTTWKWGLINKLEAIGLKGQLPNFIKEFLKDRKFRIRIGTKMSNQKSQIEGLPQGSVLSCELFKIAINDLIKDIPSGVKYILYVDDLLVYMEGRSIRTMERVIQLTINRITKNAEYLGYSFSREKTQAIIFSRRGDRNTLQLKIHNHEIRVQNEMKYLGIIFDSRMKWTKHLNKIKKDSQDPLNLMKYLSHLNWGADKKTLTKLYKSLVQPKMDYGSEIFANQKNSETMNKIQNQAMRIISGAFRSSPIKSLQVECHLPPYDL